MAITKKPEGNKQKDETKINAVISKGGSVGKSKPPNHQKVLLRIPGELLEQIDDALASNTIKVPRNTWILEAVAEKLEKE